MNKLPNWTDLPENIRDLLAEIEPDYEELEAMVQFAQSQDMDPMDFISDIYWSKTRKFLSKAQMEALQEALTNPH